MNKITKLETELLIEKRIERVDSNKDYAKKLFKTYYKDDVKDNLKAWDGINDKEKEKIIKQIITWEDKAALQHGKGMFRWDMKKIMGFVIRFKHEQLIEFGIRNKDE